MIKGPFTMHCGAVCSAVDMRGHVVSARTRNTPRLSAALRNSTQDSAVLLQSAAECCGGLRNVAECCAINSARKSRRVRFVSAWCFVHARIRAYPHTLWTPLTLPADCLPILNNSSPIGTYYSPWGTMGVPLPFYKFYYHHIHLFQQILSANASIGF